MEEDRTKGWAFVVVGVLCLAFAVLLYYLFTKLEHSGGSIRLPGILVLIHGVLGKWGAVGVTAGFGAIATWLGIDEIRQQDE